MADPADGDRPKAKSLRPLAALWPFIWPHRGTLIAAIAALLIAAAALLALPVALRYLIDNGFIAQDVATVNRYFGWFLLAALVFSGFAALRYYLVTWLGERVVADLRDEQVHQGRLPRNAAAGAECRTRVGCRQHGEGC